MSNETALARHALLVRSLLRGDAFATPPAERSLIETHISSLVLAGGYVYKLRKPLKFDFLDFSTPALRHFDCLEELRLNNRTAPQLYVDVLPIVGTPDAPRIGTHADAPRAIDWALRMRRFDQDHLLDAMARAGTLAAAQIDALAERVAAFHASLPPAPPLHDRDHDHSRGQAATVRAWALANLDALRAGATSAAQVERIAALRRWTDRECTRLAPLMRQRELHGHVRECHGDLHLRNIVLIDGVPLPFDGIEFDAEMRRIDVVNDIAFTFMDLLGHGLPEFAWRFASGYAEHSGDYAGLALLRFFAVYRALVRARVALLRAEQVQAEAGAEAKAGARDSIEQYLALAESLADPAATRQPLLVLTSGVSGSGKSTVAQCLAQHLGAVRVRSDVERKRLFALAATTRPAPAELATLYGADATQRTYTRLGELARGLLQAGVSVVVDAVALRRSERDALRGLADACGARFGVVECHAPEPVLRARIERRLREAKDASDADERVLALQLRAREPAAADEAAVAFDTDCAMEELECRCKVTAARLQSAPHPRESPLQ